MKNSHTCGSGPSLKLDVPVIGILRGVEKTFFQEIMAASFAAGLQAIEITMNTSGSEEIVASQRRAVPPGKLLGMGTIRTLAEASRAVAAGAMFLVTPNLDLTVLAYAKEQGIPVIAGALTPTEIYSAWSAGAAMIKVFPCRSLGGPQYIRSLRGPFENIPLMAVGGVSLANLQDFFASGVNAVGVGSSLFGSEALEKKNINELTRNVKEFIDNCLAAYGS